MATDDVSQFLLQPLETPDDKDQDPSKMTAKGDRKKSLVAVSAGGAQEDGDFVALRESREMQEEVLKIEATVVWDEIYKAERDKARAPEIVDLSSIPDAVPPPGRPASAKSRPGTAKLIRRQTGGISPWNDLIDAASSSVTAFREALAKIEKSHKLTDVKVQDPRTNQNILHFALDFGDEQILSLVIERADDILAQQHYDITVSKMTGKRNAFHQLVEQNDLERLKTLLKKINKPGNQQAVLLQETRVEIKGQRPRTFPALHLAAYYGFKDILVFLLDFGLDVNHLNAKKDTALLWAARWGHTECVRMLLKRGAHPGIENDKGSTALYWAVRYGHGDTLELLAREGKADVNQTRKLGLVAPIVLACALGYESIVVTLLQYGANPNTIIRGGERPIHHAAREGFSKLIELLISKGATVDSADERGDTALLLTARHGNVKALQTLLKHGASLSVKNHMGEDVWSTAVANDNDLILRLLVSHQRARMEEDDGLMVAPSGYNSLLFLAATFGNTSRLELLFDMEIDASVTDENGNNFLHFAAMNDQAEVLTKFHKKINLDIANNYGNTPLHEACSKGHHDVIMELIRLKAMANIKNKKGETALHVAAYSTTIQPHTVSKLMEYVVKTHPWECLNIKDNEGNNPLHIAAKHAKQEVIWEFRFVRFKDSDADGNIPLHEAVRPGEPECIETMLDIYETMKRDCDINHRNAKLETVLFLAARHGFLDSVKRFMLFGADISLPDHSGNTVLHELTKLVVEDHTHCNRYMELINAILQKAPMWYCAHNNITLHDSDKDMAAFYRRKGILHLVMEIPNNESLNVLDLACKVGADPVVHLLTNMENVTLFKTSHSLRYDITHITPRTNETLTRSFTNGSVSPKASCLEWLLSVDTPQRAANILDIQPFSDIETAYSSVAAWAYAIIMIVHILYMSIFSWSGVTLLEKSRKNPGDRDMDGASYVLYIIVPLEPTFIIIYNTYSIFKMCCKGEFSIKSQLKQGGFRGSLMMLLPVLVQSFYCIFVITWIITYATDYSYMDYFLSIALLIGWLFSISFTRGFKIIHHFWRMIQYMIYKDIFKFIVIYLFVLLAFSFAIHVAIQFSTNLSSTFPNPASTMYMVFNLMVGMTELLDGELTNVESSSNNLYIKLIYVLYIVLATIVLLNLLIAMMNDSYQAIQQRQKLIWRIESVQLGVDVEKSVPSSFDLFSKIKMRKGFICPSDREKGHQRWYIEVPVTPTKFVMKSEEEEERQVINEIQTKINNLNAKMSDQIQTLRNNIEDMHTVLKNIEQSMADKNNSHL